MEAKLGTFEDREAVDMTRKIFVSISADGTTRVRAFVK